MSEGFQHLRVERDTRGVATVTFDVKGSPVNIFQRSEVFLRTLPSDRATRARACRGSWCSAAPKSSGFMAGADVHRIRHMETETEVRTVLAAGHELFDRIERLPCPTVAVLHGPCLGGGLEFALACRYRIARDDAQTKIGLPEVMLGLIPGWGGRRSGSRESSGLRQALADDPRRSNPHRIEGGRGEACRYHDSRQRLRHRCESVRR